MEEVTTLRFAVGTVIGQIRLCVASELIIAARAAAAEMQLKVGGGFEILENSFGGCDGTVALDVSRAG
jgi:hypothetical protein